MKLLLIHGMGRTPISMLLLQHRLNSWGFNAQLFGYVPAVETIEGVTSRLLRTVERIGHQGPYALVGHSLGTVLIRKVLPHLDISQPSTCFFLAPPMKACRSAKTFSKFLPYKLVNGQMGQLLAREDFMTSLETPPNTKVYVGTGGFRGPLSPFGDEPNDGSQSRHAHR